MGEYTDKCVFFLRFTSSHISYNDAIISVVNECPSGYQVIGNLCYPCPRGTYKATYRNEGCVACSSGMYCQGQGNQQPTGPCATGHYCPEGSSNPNGIVCPINHYCPKGSSSPKPCPIDRRSYQQSGDASQCTYRGKLELHYLGNYIRGEYP